MEGLRRQLMNMDELFDFRASSDDKVDNYWWLQSVHKIVFGWCEYTVTLVAGLGMFTLTKNVERRIKNSRHGCKTSRSNPMRFYQHCSICSLVKNLKNIWNCILETIQIKTFVIKAQTVLCEEGVHDLFLNILCSLHPWTNLYIYT